MNAHVSFSTANTAAPDLETAVRRVLEGAPGRVALRVAVPGAGDGARLRRRVARALLQEAAMTGGGQLVQTTTQEYALLGAGAQPAERAARRLVEFGCAEAAITVWDLPRHFPELLAWAQACQAGPPPATELPPLAGFEAQLAGITLQRVLRAAPVMQWEAGGKPRLAARYLWVDTVALASALGAPGQDPDLLRHAEQALLLRMGESLAGLQDDSATPLLLPLAAGAEERCGLAPRPGSVAILPVTLASDPTLLATAGLHLQGLGWRSALLLDATLLSLLDPAALGVDLLLLRWSDALARPDALDPLDDIDSARLVLTECRGRAVAWGQARGITAFAPPAGAALPPP